MMGASGQWCFISGHHFVVTFSKDEGLTTLKQMRNTSVWKEKHIVHNENTITLRLYTIVDLRNDIWQTPFLMIKFHRYNNNKFISSSTPEWLTRLSINIISPLLISQIHMWVAAIPDNSHLWIG